MPRPSRLLTVDRRRAAGHAVPPGAPTGAGARTRRRPARLVRHGRRRDRRLRAGPPGRRVRASATDSTRACCGRKLARGGAAALDVRMLGAPRRRLRRRRSRRSPPGYGSWISPTWTVCWRAGPCVFEGAQGVLLDEWHGFHPYTTWSTTTFANAEALLGRRAGACRLGVLRTYTTRHGAGPLVTEDAGSPRRCRTRTTGTARGRARSGSATSTRSRTATPSRCAAASTGSRSPTSTRPSATPSLRICRSYQCPSERVTPSGTGAVPGPRLPGSSHGTAAGSTAGPGSRCSRGLGLRRGVRPRRTRGARRRTAPPRAATGGHYARGGGFSTVMDLAKRRGRRRGGLPTRRAARRPAGAGTPTPP